MKRLLLLPILASQLAWADCDMRSASQLASQHTVSAVTNLTKNISQGKCAVTFDLTVDGVVHHLTDSHTGADSEDTLCRIAQEKARKNLLVGLGGTFNTESVTVCSEGQKVNHKTKIGDVILENEVGPARVTKYFNYQNSRCRLFSEHLEVKGELRVYYGVICQLDNSAANWIVVDKW